MTPKPLKIVSDGYTMNTKIIDQDTGRELPWVKSVTWHAEVGQIIATATVVFLKVEADLETLVEKEEVA